MTAFTMSRTEAETGRDNANQNNAGSIWDLFKSYLKQSGDAITVHVHPDFADILLDYIHLTPQQIDRKYY